MPTPQFPDYQHTNIIIACSGGPDSTALLYLTYEWAIEHGNTLIVASYDHQLRPESHEDILLTREHTEKLGIVFEAGSGDVNQYAKDHKMSTEMAARELRMVWFQGVAQKHDAQYIFTGHTMDDQAETLLYRITRGTGLGGLTGIPYQNGLFTRPLLHIRKHELIDYLQENDIKYAIDATNNESIYDRNKLRNLVIPELLNINDHVIENIVRLSQGANEYTSLITDLLSTHIEHRSIHEDDFTTLHPLLQKELIRQWYQQQAGGTVGLSEANIGEFVRFCSEAKGGTEKSLGNLKLKKKNRIISIRS